MDRKKFTLIELLVVVAIIGILASLLLPSLSKARKKAQMAVCKSNMKQLNIAYNLYYDDNDNYFPLDSSNLSWDDHLNGYDGRNVSFTDLNTNAGVPKDQYGSTNVYACPSDSSEIFSANNMTLTYSPTQYIHHNSGVNGTDRGLTGWHHNQGTLLSVNINNIQDTSYTLSLIEFMDGNRAVGRNHMSVVRIGDHFLNNPANHPHQSSKKLNFLFVDGHVESLDYLSTLRRTDGGMGTASDTRLTMWDAHK